MKKNDLVDYKQFIKFRGWVKQFDPDISRIEIKY